MGDAPRDHGSARALRDAGFAGPQDEGERKGFRCKNTFSLILRDCAAIVSKGEGPRAPEVATGHSFRYSAYTRILKLWMSAAAAFCFATGAAAADAPRLMVLGDSLTAGYGLPQEAAFPVRLEAALREKGIAWSFSRISVFSPGSLAAHTRMGAVPVGSLTAVQGAGRQLVFSSVPPRVRWSRLDGALPRYRLSAPPVRGSQIR